MGFLTDWLRGKADSTIIDAIILSSNTANYYKEVAKQIAISYIANTISKCEFKVYENGTEVKNKFYYLLNVRPNPNQNSSEFINKWIQTLYRNNEALLVPLNDKIYVADGFTKEEHQLKDNVFKGISIEGQTIKRSFKASDVFYFRLDDKEIDKLVNGLYEIYSQIIQSALNNYKKNNGKKYKLSLEQIRVGDKEFQEKFEKTIKKNLEDFIEAESAVLPEYKGMELKEFGDASKTSTGNASDLINIRKEIFEIIAQAYKIPMPMMYGNITNINDIVNVFLTFCIDPLADMLEEELTGKTNTFATWNGGENYVTVDTTCINHIDIFDIAEKIDKLISCGMYCVDDLREKVGDIPLNTEFSRKHWVTKNYSNVEDINNELEVVNK